VTPLREGGSLPAIVEGDDDGTYAAGTSRLASASELREPDSGIMAGR
jgi:hypothetical protein